MERLLSRSSVILRIGRLQYLFLQKKNQILQWEKQCKKKLNVLDIYFPKKTSPTFCFKL